MKFELEVGSTEKHQITFDRSWFTGAMSIKVDGHEVASRSSLNPATHVFFELVERFPFSVGQGDRHDVLIEHERPVLIAGLRPHKYRVFVDGQLVQERRGY